VRALVQVPTPLQVRSFRKADFIECAEGEVRLGMSLRQEMVGTMPLWANEVAPYAEALRNLLAGSVRSGATETAPLTNARRKAAARKRTNGDISVRAAREAAMVRMRAKQGGSDHDNRLALWRCPDCGGAVSNPRRVRCDSCIDADPVQTTELRQARARAISARRQTEAGWSAEHHPGVFVDRRWATEVLLPALGKLKLREVMAAPGVAKSTASGWRSGRSVPHPMHWEVLAGLAGVSATKIVAT